jgi:hypothetical protein
MEALIFALVAIAGWFVLAAGGSWWGVDSRPGIGDDHAR